MLALSFPGTRSSLQVLSSSALPRGRQPSSGGGSVVERGNGDHLCISLPWFPITQVTLERWDQRLALEQVRGLGPRNADSLQPMQEGAGVWVVVVVGGVPSVCQLIQVVPGGRHWGEAGPRGGAGHLGEHRDCRCPQSLETFLGGESQAG